MGKERLIYWAIFTLAILMALCFKKNKRFFRGIIIFPLSGILFLFIYGFFIKSPQLYVPINKFTLLISGCLGFFGVLLLSVIRFLFGI